MGREMEEVKKEDKVWELVRKERKKGINEEIKMEEENIFYDLKEGVEERMRRGGERKREERGKTELE